LIDCEITKNYFLNVPNRYCHRLPVGHSCLNFLLCRWCEVFPIPWISSLSLVCSSPPTSHCICVTRRDCLHLCSVGGWSVRWSFCCASIGQIVVSALIYCTFCNCWDICGQCTDIAIWRLNASSNSCSKTWLSACTMSSVSLIIVFDVAEWPLLSLCVALRPPRVKSGHHLHIYWMSITSAQYMATLCLWMLMGSMFCVHRNLIAVWNSSLTHSFSKVPILQLTALAQHFLQWWRYLPVPVKVLALQQWDHIQYLTK